MNLKDHVCKLNYHLATFQASHSRFQCAGCVSQCGILIPCIAYLEACFHAKYAPSAVLGHVL